MKLILSVLFLLVCVVFLIYSKTPHFKNRYSPEVLKKNRLAKAENEHASSFNDIFFRIEKMSLPSALADLSERPADSAQRSHIGGPVFLPNDIGYPLDVTGRPMVFLFQINFAEMPSLSGYPANGVLQFFARLNEELGLSNNVEKNYQLFYWPKAESLTQKHEAIEIDNLYDMLPYKKNYRDTDWTKTKAFEIHAKGRALIFRSEPFNFMPWPHDFPAESYLLTQKNFDQDIELHDAVEQHNEASVVRIGGYPTFSQWDPRFPAPGSSNRAEEIEKGTVYTRVLINLNSIGELMIWDGGTINILISPEDLKAQNFDNIIYDIAGG